MKHFLFYFLSTIASVFLFTACGGDSGGSGGSGGGGSSAVDNISGLVSESASSSSISGKPIASQKVGTMSVSGCTVTAYNIDTNAVVATATTDASGKYTITGVSAGTTYKVVVECGSNSFSVVASAENSDPTQKDDNERVATNPRSTIIAAYIVKSIKEAVDEATDGLPQAAQDAVKDAILAALDNIVQTITETIEEAIESGAMDEPNLGTAKNVADDLKNANDAGAIDTSLGNAGVSAPKSVDQAITGARQASALTSACDSTLAGASRDKCRRTIARFMYNALGFAVVIRRDGGGMFANDDCVAGDATNVTGKNLGDLFPNGEFQDARNADNSLDAGEHCMISPKLGRPDRNRGYKDGGDGGGGPVFAETGDLDGADDGDDTGVLTALADALYDGNTYNLKSMDKLVFGYENGAGMNNRMVKQSRQWRDQGGGQFAMENVLEAWDGSQWNALNVSTACGGNRCYGAWDLVDSFNFSSMLWSSRTANTPLSDAVSAVSHVDFNVFYHNYAGPVPTQSELDRSIDGEKTHRDYNISGEKEIYVLTNKPPAYADNGTNACYDNDPSTPCLAQDGTAITGTRFNITLGAEDAEGFKPLTALTKDANGNVLLRPMWGPLGFSGVFGLVNLSTGRIMQDELFRERAIKIVFGNSECNNAGGNGFPAAGANCGQGKILNVQLDWSGCNGNPGDPCPGYSALSTTALTADANDFNLRKDYLQAWGQVGGSGNHYGLLATGTWENSTPIYYTVTPAAGNDTIAVSAANNTMEAGEYGIAINWDCSATTHCVPAGFVFIDSNGDPHEDADCTANCSQDASWQGSGNAATIYTDVIVDALTSDGNGGTVASTTLRYHVFNGPIRNPNFSCEAEPYFVDGNGNGRLDCAVVNGFSVATGGDVSFSYIGEYFRQVQDGNVTAGSQLIPRDNAFVYGDPLGTKKLLSNAFNGWFDGTRSIDQNTSFNSIQVFALIFLFFEADEEKHIDELCNGGAIGGTTTDCEGAFVPVGPFDSNFSLKNMNGTIGNAMTEFKTN